MSEKTSKILDSLFSIEFSQNSFKEILSFIDASLTPDHKITKETASSQQKRLFLQKSKQTLEHYRPQHEKLSAVSQKNSRNRLFFEDFEDFNGFQQLPRENRAIFQRFAVSRPFVVVKAEEFPRKRSRNP